MLSSYVTVFGTEPKQTVNTPLEKGDHPELDESVVLDIGNVKKYQSLNGSLLQAIYLGNWDIATEVMTMSKFRAEP